MLLAPSIRWWGEFRRPLFCLKQHLIKRLVTLLKEAIPFVSKPVRYIGREVNSARKDPGRTRLRFCLAFPDVYEVGMSHLGIQILYHLLNEREGISCERVFAPWVDMEQQLRERALPLSSLESFTPLQEFDVIGFSLQYELCYTNVLNMLDLAHIPLLSKERGERFPLIIAGGPSACNPEPVAEFFDALVVGDGEEVIVEICDQVLQNQEAGGSRDDLLMSLSRLEGVYVPHVHKDGVKIRKRLVADLNLAPYPTCPIVPYMKVVHDRLSMEIARGCKRGCRFCEAGFINRPYRERSPDRIQEILAASLKGTGYEEFSLLSLSAGDYSGIGPLLNSLVNRFESRKIAVSFPSLRIESIVGYLAEQVKRVRKTGFTIAPEAGTERLRRVINKELDEAVLSQGVSDLFSMGWRNIKLYFMIGLPTEREEDVKGIISLSKHLLSLAGKTKIYPNLSVSVSTFVPKPHTPFQWEPQISLEEMKEKLRFLREASKRQRFQFKWQDPHLSTLEGIFSTGDRTLSRVVREAHALGCRFDGWSDQFRFSLWEKAFEKAEWTPTPPRKKTPGDPLPWSFIETGVDTGFLWGEYQKALKEELSPPCSGERCQRCGVCNGETVQLKEDGRCESRPPVPADAPGKREQGPLRKKGTERKIRLTFTKGGGLQFISHLELSHLFHRASKRADLSLRYSEGFHPMPRIIFPNALPVGVESLGELVDMELEGTVVPQEIQERLNRVLPEGIRIREAKEVPFLSSPSSGQTRSVYRITLDWPLLKEEAASKIKKALEKEAWLIHQERKGKKRQVDIRPLIDRMEIVSLSPSPAEASSIEGNGRFGVEMVLRQSSSGSAKPTEILNAVLEIGQEALSRCEVVKIE